VGSLLIFRGQKGSASKEVWETLLWNIVGVQHTAGPFALPSVLPVAIHFSLYVAEYARHHC